MAAREEDDDLLAIAILLALQEQPGLMDTEESLMRRAQEILAMGEDGMRRLARRLQRQRNN